MLQSERATYLFQNIFHLKQDCILHNTMDENRKKNVSTTYLNFRAKIINMLFKVVIFSAKIHMTF